jgi:thymidylate kinase
VNRRRVVIFDRYFYDRFIHFNADGTIFKLAWLLAPTPDVGFVLLPAHDAWEQRILNRLRKRFGVAVERLSDDDRDQLTFVRNRYESFMNMNPELLRVDSAQADACDSAAALLLNHMNGAAASHRASAVAVVPQTSQQE